MDSALQEPVQVKPPRRSACDRCRGQKLRCERPSSSSSIDEGCRRCLKAGVHCVSTFSHAINKVRSSMDNASLPSDWIDGMGSSVFDTNHEVITVPPSLLLLDADSQPLQLSPDASPGRAPSETCLDAAIAALPTSSFFEFSQAWIDGETSCDAQKNRSNTTAPALNSHEMTPLTSHQDASPHTSTHSSLDRFRWRRSRNQEMINCAPKVNENWKKRLSEISVVLLQDLALIESGQIAGTLLFFSIPQQQTGMSTTETGSQQYLIGHMLNSSEELLSTLREFKLSRPCSRSGVDILSRQKDRGNYPSFMTGQNASQPGSFTMGDTSPALAPICPAAIGLQSKRPANDESEALDPIMTLLILTCYTILLRIYREVFSLIRDSIANTATAVESNFVPTLPSIQIEGLDVGRRRDLQIRILLQTSAHLIRQIDECMHAIRLDMHGGVPRRLFDVVLDLPEGGGSCGDVGHLKKSLTQIVRAINLKLGDDWEF